MQSSGLRGCRDSVPILEDARKVAMWAMPRDVSVCVKEIVQNHQPQENVSPQVTT